jgi:hypothetical protein
MFVLLFLYLYCKLLYFTCIYLINMLYDCLKKNWYNILLAH